MNLDALKAAAERLDKRRPPFTRHGHIIKNRFGNPLCAFAPDPIGESIAADFALAANALPGLLAVAEAVLDGKALAEAIALHEEAAGKAVLAQQEAGSVAFLQHAIAVERRQKAIAAALRRLED